MPFSSREPDSRSIPGVLIVDDDATTARSLSWALRSAGYKTDTARNAAEALAIATKTPPEGVLIDIHLPDLNGLVLAAKLREQLGPKVPLLILSGDTSMETIRTLPHVGVNYFLSKPINPPNLLEILARWLPPSKPANDGQLGDADLNPEPA